MTAEAIRAAAANFPNCVAATVARCRAARHLAREFRRFTADLTPDLRIMDLMDSQPEFTKSIWDYLDILVNDESHQRGPRNPGQVQAELRRGGKRLRRRPLYRRRDLGRRIELSARWSATGRCCAPPRRWPASAAGRATSETNFSRRWKSCIAAICARNSSRARGPARSARRSSCRPRSSASRSTATAMAAATWSISAAT